MTHAMPTDRSAKNVRSWFRYPKALSERTDLDPLAKQLLCVLRDRIGANGECWPGQRRLCADLGCRTNEAVTRATRTLESAGLLVVERGSGLSGSRAERTNRYRLTDAGLALFGGERPPPPVEANGRDSEPLNGRESGPLAKPPTVGNPAPQRAGTPASNGRESRPELDQENKTKGTRPKARAKARPADPWEQARAAMTNGTLDTERFEAAWRAWAKYRRELRKALTPSTVGQQIKKLEGFGHDNAVQSIEQSIATGWTGLFDPSSRDRPASGRGDGHRGRRAPGGLRPERIDVPDFKP